MGRTVLSLTSASPHKISANNSEWMRMRHAKRTDDVQQSIVEALRRAGVAVYVVGLPLDLLCAVRDPGPSYGYRTILLECKDDDGRFTKTQSEFMASWPGELHVVRSPQEALEACFGNYMQ